MAASMGCSDVPGSLVADLMKPAIPHMFTDSRGNEEWCYGKTSRPNKRHIFFTQPLPDHLPVFLNRLVSNRERLSRAPARGSCQIQDEVTRERQTVDQNPTRRERC